MTSKQIRQKQIKYSVTTSPLSHLLERYNLMEDEERKKVFKILLRKRLFDKDNDKQNAQ
jgi:hypothetical protein